MASAWEWDDVARQLSQGAAIDDRLDVALSLMAKLGFTALIYDYTPVPLSVEKRIIPPNVVKVSNVPENFTDLWINLAYACIDPVQILSVSAALPFVWSLVDGENRGLESVIQPEHGPAVSYLRDTGMTCGITMPIHQPGGDLANLTAIRTNAERDFDVDARLHLADFVVLGSLFHAAVYPLLDPQSRTCHHVSLTMREQECLQLCARGLTAKQIAHALDRSIATVTLHLNNAVRKLGAHNRPHAVAKAAHYRLIEDAR